MTLGYSKWDKLGLSDASDNEEQQEQRQPKMSSKAGCDHFNLFDLMKRRMRENAERYSRLQHHPQTFSGVAREKVDAVFIFSNGACKYNQAKINSGEVKDQANARYELIKIPRTQEAFKQPISPILNLLSRPVRMFRFPSTDAEIEEMNSMTNQYATLLMRNMSTKAEDWSVDPEIMSFGFTPLSWQDYPGTVLVVAADGKSLSLDYVHALVDFNVTRVGRVIQRDSEIGVSPLEMIKEFGLVQLIVHVQETEIRQVTEDGGGFNVHGWLYGYHQELQKAGKIKFVL